MIDESSLDGARLRRVLGAFPSGVTAVAALVDGRPAGLAANSFTSVSLDPPLVSICIAHSSRTWRRLRSAARCGISVLAADQEQVCRQLATSNADKFVGLDWHATTHGAVLMQGAPAWFECSVEQQIPAGDHDIVLLRIHDLGVEQTVRPLVFHGSRFHQLAP
ncbi:flavin reductase [Micromonospora zingiberis]|uniref:Flavin reductase n=1 Tax=Micromonospora zingiberis TaxID=2053011 RepID=A0A4R0GJR5_9ACTN|nr:flavin reductase family protein [Micromonospora zingiberis]TCB96722.1 flavin reductase [Micromonospora zingiberis]